jgi:hypothetical protein
LRLARVIYSVAVISVGLGSLSVGALSEDVGLPLLIILQSALAVLTFPSGFVASLVSGALVFSGITTLLEATVLTTPIFAALGYMQWFWLFPKIYRADHNRNPASDVDPQG